ncbi:MAG: hypothetical protein WAV85_12850 [Rhodoferax sp.]
MSRDTISDHAARTGAHLLPQKDQQAEQNADSENGNGIDHGVINSFCDSDEMQNRWHSHTGQGLKSSALSDCIAPRLF